MSYFKITCRFTDAVRFEGEFGSLKLCVEAAVKAGAYLADANLPGANLARANLARADLARANLAGANLADANLADANLARADLARANLAGAYLAGADLAGAYLADANLPGANLARANLAGAYLADADLAGAKNTPKRLPHFQLPDGDLIGWKKCGPHIVKLLIPADAKRTASLVGRKCRAEFAKVLEIDGAEEAVSGHDCATVYRVGETVRPDSYDDNPLVECTHGIHWFATRAEAEEYQ